MKKEEEIWKIINERCNKWRYVFDFSNLKDERFKILNDLLEEEFKANPSQQIKLNLKKEEY